MNQVCPECGGGDIATERSPWGSTICYTCNYSAKHAVWNKRSARAEKEKERRVQFLKSLDTPEKQLVWIEKARALLFDCQFCVDSPKIIKEIETLINN